MRSRSDSEPLATPLSSRSRRGEHDYGSVTAELAVAFPAVVIVLAIGIWGVQLAAVQVRMHDAAGLASRAAARGDDPLVAASAHPGSAITTWADGDLVCARAAIEVASPVGLPPVTVAADSCSLLQRW
jgi:hypothetical protein